MRLGMMIGYSGSQLLIDMDLIKEAEKLGYDSVWSAEAYGSDAVTPLAYIAAQTSKIKLGTGIMQLPGRTPANTAMTAVKSTAPIAVPAASSCAAPGRASSPAWTRRRSISRTMPA